MDRSCTKKIRIILKKKKEKKEREREESRRKIINQYSYRLIKLGAIYVIDLTQSTQMVVTIVLLIDEINLMQVSLEIVGPDTQEVTIIIIKL